MPIIIKKMVDQEHCVICGEYICKGHDPAICNKERCILDFETEVAFNKAAREEVEKWSNTTT